MRAWTLLVLAAVAALTITLGPRPPRASGGAFACDIHDVFYDVTGVRLTERIPAVWSYTGDTGDATAQVTTTQTGTLDWHQAHSTKAQRAKYRQMATFEELTGACRVGDWRQGTIRAKAQGMDYAVSGTWNAG